MKDMDMVEYIQMLQQHCKGAESQMDAGCAWNLGSGYCAKKGYTWMGHLVTKKCDSNCIGYVSKEKIIEAIGAKSATGNAATTVVENDSSGGETNYG